MKAKTCRVLAVVALISLGACGGGGGDGPPPAPSSKLFVVDSGNAAIGSLVNSNPAPGPFAIDRIISGSLTGLGTPPQSVSNIPSLALDPAADRIFVATQTNVRVWDSAGFVSGNVPPSRVITSTFMDGATQRGVNFTSLFLDTTNNRLYAAGGEFVHVFNGASTLTGTVTPSRTIKPDLGGATILFPFGIAVDLAQDMLYVGLIPSDSRIAVFHNQSSLNPASGTTSTPDRVLSSIPQGASSFYLDAVNNRLYIATGGSSTPAVIRVYDNASTIASGPLGPGDRSFTVGATNRPKYIFVDVPNNRLYAVSDNFVFIIPNASTANDPGVVGTIVQVQSTGSLFSAVAVKP